MSCCGLRKRKAKRPDSETTFHQTLVLLRHSERKDYVDELYKTSGEGLAWPHDAPLTEHGVQLAQEAAMELLHLHTEVRFSAVVSSPYLRCLETAAELTKLLKLPLLVDQEIGEIWDSEMPRNPQPWRSPEELAGLLKKLEVEEVLNPDLPAGGIKPFGKAPTYPETLEAAHQRFVVRMEMYITQSAELSTNFILVTHADALVGVLRMFERGQADVSKIEFCARIIARRSVEHAPSVKSNSMTRSLSTSSLSTVQFFKTNFAHAQDAQAATTPINPFAYRWTLDCKGIDVEVYEHTGLASQYYERMHLENCEVTEARHLERLTSGCSSDEAFGKALSMQSMRTSSMCTSPYEVVKDDAENRHTVSETELRNPVTLTVESKHVEYDLDFDV